MKSKKDFFKIFFLTSIVHKFLLIFRIKNVIAKKDETYNQLKQQYEAAAKRADHLEGLLEQQRTLMIKKQASSN